jgi:pyruvyl transferase EpsO
MASRASLISRLMARIDAVLRPLIPFGQSVALVDFPNHPNVGDSAIWLGEAAWFVSNENERRYVCGRRDYSASALRRHLPSGPIVIHGGGNFGDLWPVHQRFRERIIREFPDRPIIQFPQTVHFADPAKLREVAAVVNAHPDFTLIVRDTRSLQLSREAFRCRTLLCPDMAFYLGEMQRPASAGQHDGTVCLMRTDRESRSTKTTSGDGDASTTVDWLKDTRTCKACAIAFHVTSPWYPRRLASWAAAMADRTATLRLRRGIRLLTQGRRVVTDRLHAHILCVLLDMPHAIVDNSYGKLSSFVETWEGNDVSWLA